MELKKIRYTEDKVYTILNIYYITHEAMKEQEGSFIPAPNFIYVLFKISSQHYIYAWITQNEYNRFYLKINQIQQFISNDEIMHNGEHAVEFYNTPPGSDIEWSIIYIAKITDEELATMLLGSQS